MRDLIEQIQRADTPVDAFPSIRALAEGRTQEGILALIELLHHPNPAIALITAQELEQLAPESVEWLITQFHNCTDQTAQTYIIRILAYIGDDRALDLLVDMVGVEVANHCQGNVRRVAARGLGKMVTPTTNPQQSCKAIKALTWALLNAEDWALRYAAAVSLGEISTAEARVALEQALTQEADPVVRERLQLLLYQSEG